MEISGSPIIGDGSIEAVLTEAAAGSILHASREFILATGGFLGGGIEVPHSGYAHDTAFNLPIQNMPSRGELFERSFLASEGQPIFHVGIAIDGEFRPIDEAGNVPHDNLSVIGSQLGFGDPIRERSREGVALGSGFVVGERMVAK
jgi:glycerol-3-phosphate dehydrogenase subunit B